MLEHDDQNQDVDMIKQVLQKIIDEMNEMEVGRIMPADKKPHAMTAEVHAVEGSPEEEAQESPEEEKTEPMELYKGSYGIPHPNADKGESIDEAEPENQFNQHEDLDPTVLQELLKKADEADENGELPEDRESDLPLELQQLVKEKKKIK